MPRSPVPGSVDPSSARSVLWLDTVSGAVAFTVRFERFDERAYLVDGYIRSWAE